MLFDGDMYVFLTHYRGVHRPARTPPLSGILLLRPPSPWEPTTTPPRILGHHNPVHSPHDLDTHSHSTHNMNDPLTSNTHNMNDPPTLYAHTHPQSHTLILNDPLIMNDTRPYRLI